MMQNLERKLKYSTLLLTKQRVNFTYAVFRRIFIFACKMKYYSSQKEKLIFQIFRM